MNSMKYFHIYKNQLTDFYVTDLHMYPFKWDKLDVFFANIGFSLRFLK